MAEPYGSGLYGSGLYGLLSESFETAQNTQVRQTGLRVRIIDEQLNAWEEIVGGQAKTHEGLSGGASSWMQSYFAYRLQMDMCVLSNGTIVRVRNGDGTSGDRQIYVQEITDPTNVSQWTTWSLLYSGTHYAVSVQPATSSTYHVYSAKSDGLYKNNSKKIDGDGIVRIDKVVSRVDAMYVTLVARDALDNHRYYDMKYVEDIDSGSWADDRWNYRWYRNDITAIENAEGQLVRIQVAAFYNDARDVSVAESMVVSFAADYTTGENPNVAPRLIRGFSGQAGYNAIAQPAVMFCSDGFYYLFYGEIRKDADGDTAVSMSTVYWQRSKDLKYWSEPIAIGYSSMRMGSYNANFQVVELDDYLYLANNGDVWRRPLDITTLELSNYIPTVQMNIASIQDGGGAEFTVANPNGLWDDIVTMGDKKVTIEPAIFNSETGEYEFEEQGIWWLKNVTKQVDGNIRRLNVTCYDFAERLENPLRDVYNFVGQTQWDDFGLGKRNKLFNYYLRGGKSKFMNDYDDDGNLRSIYYYAYRISDYHTALLTAWKGHNFDASVRYRGGSLANRRFGLVYRWADSRNFYWARVNDDTLELVRMRDGDVDIMDTYSIGSAPSNPTIRVVTEFGFHYVYLNGTLRITYNEVLPTTKPGYVGIRFFGNNGSYTTMGADRFTMTSWEINHTTETLVKTALAMADFHDVSAGGAGDAQQLAVVWGPQSDIANPLQALRSLFEQNKLEMSWRNGQLEVGKFTDTESQRTFENDITRFELTEQNGKRVNLAVVDGREDTYIEIDGVDTRQRGRQVVSYSDVPELDTTEKVRDRAREEVRRGVVGSKYQGESRLYFGLSRMDLTTWVDGAGVEYYLRIEQMEININQSTEPRQDVTYTLSPLSEFDS